MQFQELSLLRDQGQCRAIEPSGERCTNRQFLDIHHIILRSEGGTDTEDNLITLCGAHRGLHQLRDTKLQIIPLSP